MPGPGSVARLAESPSLLSLPGVDFYQWVGLLICVAGGKKVRIDKVGILTVKDRAARKGRNPQTGEEIKIPASKKISFRVAKSLKERVGTIKKTAKKK